jgi:hypothetical protein
MIPPLHFRPVTDCQIPVVILQGFQACLTRPAEIDPASSVEIDARRDPLPADTHPQRLHLVQRVLPSLRIEASKSSVSCRAAQQYFGDLASSTSCHDPSMCAMRQPLWKNTHATGRRAACHYRIARRVRPLTHSLSKLVAYHPPLKSQPHAHAYYCERRTHMATTRAAGMVSLELSDSFSCSHRGPVGDLWILFWVAFAVSLQCRRPLCLTRNMSCVFRTDLMPGRCSV